MYFPDSSHLPLPTVLNQPVESSGCVHMGGNGQVQGPCCYPCSAILERLRDCTFENEVSKNIGKREVQKAGRQVVCSVGSQEKQSLREDAVQTLAQGRGGCGVGAALRSLQPLPCPPPRAPTRAPR